MEIMRRWIRNAIGYRSWPYQTAARCVNMYYALRREGLQGLALMRMQNSPGAAVQLNLRSLRHPILVRP